MKKVIVTIAVALASVCAANAQLSLGGDLGFQYSSTENYSDVISAKGFGVGQNSLDLTNSNNDQSTWGINVDPKIGYDLSDKMTIGAYISLGYTKSTVDNGEVALGLGTDDLEYSSFNWGVKPFFRYNAFQFGKFGVAFEATIGINGANYKVEDADPEPSSFGFGINVKPFLTYALNSNWSLETGLNFLSLGYNYTSIDHDSNADDTKVSQFGIGVDANNVTTLGAITVGAVYHF